MSDRLTAAIARIDAANVDDPVLVRTDRGPRPKELVHAEAVTSWLLRLDDQADEGFSDVEVASVQRIVRKEGLGSDPRVQTHEDALCLVFMEQQLADFATRPGAEKAAAVLAMTVAKMSPDGRAEASVLDLGPRMGAMVTAAIDAADGAVSDTP